jgi:diacylglycerol kinase family enzyme
MTRLTPFDSFLIIRNPASTSVTAANRRIAELQRAFPSATCHIIDTRPGGKAANRALLHDQAGQLGRRTLLCVAGGDGTINLVLDSLLHDPALSAQGRQTPIFPLWGGNANDLACMLNGGPRSANTTAIVRTGSIVAVFPLVCSFTNRQGRQTTHLAACYTSFGASAITTQILGQKKSTSNALFRQPGLRFIREVLIAISGMSHAPTFAINSDGQTKTVYEYIFFNGPRFAKVTGVRRQLIDQKFHGVLLGKKRLSGVLASMAALNRKNQAHKFEHTQANFTVRQTTWSQFDGETIRVPAGTTVTISVAEQPFFALSTRLGQAG